MSDCEIKYSKIHGISPQLAEDLKCAAAEGVSYGTYMWLKNERKLQAQYEKLAKRKNQRKC